LKQPPRSSEGLPEPSAEPLPDAPAGESGEPQSPSRELAEVPARPVEVVASRIEAQDPPMSPEEAAIVFKYARASKAKNTWRSYGTQWKSFVAWCGDLGASSLPASPGIVARYLSWMAESGRPVSSIGQALAAISFFHRYDQNGVEQNPAAVQFSKTSAVRTVLEGIKRELKGKPVRKALPLDTEMLKRLLAVSSRKNRLRGLRDRAILLVGFFGALRREEIVGIDCEDIRPAKNAEGIVIRLSKSKTNQRGERVEEIPFPRGKDNSFCPCFVLGDWVEKAGIRQGPVFVSTKSGVGQKRLTPEMVARIVRKLAVRAGIPPETCEELAGHSLRRGFATSASELGATEDEIAAQTRHRDKKVLKGYIAAPTDDRALFERSAAKHLFKKPGNA